MGEPSSARPAALLAYSRQGVARDATWEAEVAPLGGALDALRRALPAGLPDDCRVAIPPLDASLARLARDTRHRDEWVGDVAHAFARADSGWFGLNGMLALIDPSRVITVDSGRIRVGAADRAAAEAQGWADAGALQALLREEGIVDWYELENNRDFLDDLADRYPQLRDAVARIGANAQDEDYVAAVFNRLGADGVQTLGDLVNQIGLAADGGALGDDAFDDFVVPLSRALAAAERSGHLDPGVLDGLFDFGPVADPDYDGDASQRQNDEYFQEMRRRSLALLVYAGDFSSAFTARAADAVTATMPVTNHLFNYEGFSDGLLVVQDHPELASTEWTVLTALTRDDRAAHLYLARHHSEEWFGNVSFLEHIAWAVLPGEYNVVAGRLGVDYRDDYFATAAAVLEAGLFRYPLATGTTYAPTTTAMVAQAVQSAADGDLADEVKRTLALVSAPYTRDLAVSAQLDQRDLPASRLAVSPDDVRAFFKELSFDETARVMLATNAAALVRGQVQAAAPDIAGHDPNAVGTEIRLATGLYVALGESMHEAMDDVLAEREAIVSAWRTVTDPIVELVTGKIVERIPIVSTAADLPVVASIVDGVTGSLNDAVNDAIYDHAVPRPDVERLSSWEDAIGPGIRDAIVEGLYADPATVAALAPAGFRGTLAEFRSLPHVQDVVNQYSQEILTGFDAQVAFDELFGR